MKPWMFMERDADLLHAAAERANRDARSEARWGAILFATCVVVVAGLIANVVWWLS